jgi:hypothetical protein
MLTLTLLLLAVLLFIIGIILLVICSPIAIIVLLGLVIDIAVLGGIFKKRR